MVFKRVDEVAEEEIEGFSFINYNGNEEKVILEGYDTVRIRDGEDGDSFFFKQDIPKLILALQAAYDHKEN